MEESESALNPLGITTEGLPPRRTGGASWKFARLWWCEFTARRPRYQEHPDYLEACRWYQDFEPAEGVDYQWAFQEARSAYDEVRVCLGALDAKAEWTFTIATIAVAGVYAAIEGLGFSLIDSLPALASFGLAMAMAIWTRSPHDTASMMPSRDTIEYLPKAQNVAAWQAAALYCCEVGMTVDACWKAGKVRCASHFLVLGFLLLLLPLGRS